jgi:hypothetical protein
MWFDFKTMFDQITKHIRHVKELNIYIWKKFVGQRNAFRNNMFINIEIYIYILKVSKSSLKKLIILNNLWSSTICVWF